MSELASVANNTKWSELRDAMLDLHPRPAFRCQSLKGYYSPPDREWFYHFRDGGYESIRWVDLVVDDLDMRRTVLCELKQIGLAGHETSEGFRVFGYIEHGQAIEYIGTDK